MNKTARSFLDTNILIYLIHDDKTKRAKAQDLVGSALERRDAVISYQVVQEFLNVATRKARRPMSTMEAQVFLGKVLMPLCVVFPDAALYSNALSIAAETGWSFYDSLIVGSALAAGCTTLLTEDLQEGRTVRGVTVRNPFRHAG
jgi:predicted nucleic acid-binding protein